MRTAIRRNWKIEQIMSLVFGLVRHNHVFADSTEFSRSRNKSLEERRRMARDPKRLRIRARIFETVCLPSLAAQPADRFTGLILTSDNLPKPFADRLKETLEPYPNIHPVFLPPTTAQEAFASAIRRFPCPDDTRLTFRLDDGDAVAADYTDYVERYRKPEYVGHCVSLFHGLGLCRLRGRTRIWERKHYMSSVGLALVGAANATDTIYDVVDHARVAEKMPTVVDATRPAFLATSHASRASSNRVPLKARLRPSTMMTQAEAAAKHGKLFPILETGDFAFLESSGFRNPGSLALGYARRLRILNGEFGDDG